MTLLPASDVDFITLHYSATYIDTEYTYEQLEADHLARGFREGGYHFYVTRERPGKPSRIIAGRDIDKAGRFEQGAHSQGENERAVGICYEGGLTRARPNTGVNTMTPNQADLIIAKITELKAFYPSAEVRGHRDMPGAATQCPGFDASAWWAGVEKERKWKSANRARCKWGAIIRAIFGKAKT